MELELREKYDNWNVQKQTLEEENTDENLYFKAKDVWWCSIGINVGSESFGKGDKFRRPIVILKRLSEELCVGIPITSKKKFGTWFSTISVNGEERSAMLYQLRTFHTKRLQRKLGELSSADFTNLKQKLENLLEL